MKSDLTCPVEVVSVNVDSGDSGTICLIRFRNLGEKEVDSVQMNIICYDQDGNRLGGRLVRAHAHEADETGFSGAFRPEHVAGTARVEASVEKLWFKDGMLWRREERNVREYESNLLPEGRELDRLRKVAGPDAAGYAREEDRVWLCVCGRANRTSDDYCRRCRRERTQVLTDYSREAIEKTIGKREKVLSEASMDAVRRSTAQNAKEAAVETARQTRKKRRLRGWIAALAVLALGLALWRWGIPACGMWLAQRRLESGKPADAKQIYETMARYFPSESAREGAAQAEAAILDGMLSSGDEATLMQARERAEAAGDSDRVRRAMLNLAQLYLGRGETAKAEDLLRQLPGSSEAEALLCRLVYDRACQARDSLRFEEAIAAFTELGAFEDSREQAVDARFLYGRALMREGRYAEAEEQFLQISSYRDSLELLRSCRYQQGQSEMHAGRYAEAAALFESLGIYEQAETLGKQCRYTLALACEQAGDLAGAAEQYAMAGQYEDAQSRFGAAALSLGKTAMEQGRYEEAMTWLEQLPLEGENRELYQQAIYAYAEEQEKAGRLEEARMSYASLGEYSDAHARAQETEYALAKESMGDNPEAALDRFLGLGTYRDAAQCAEACRQKLAESAWAAGEYEAALGWYEEMTPGEEREAQMQRCRYALAAQLEQAGNWEGAEAMYEACGPYLDAEEARWRMAFRQAEALEAAGKYEEAAEAFRKVAYPGAAESAVRCEDEWLGKVYRDAALDLENGNYAAVIEACEPYLDKTLPARFADLREKYEQACLARAQVLIDTGYPLEALPYLERIPDNKTAQKRLSDYVYRIIGRWKDKSGVEYLFRRDGSCRIAGKDGYFSGSGYEIRVGTEKPPAKAAYQVINLRGQTLTLKDLAQDRNVRLTYVGEAEKEEADPEPLATAQEADRAMETEEKTAE